MLKKLIDIIKDKDHLVHGCLTVDEKGICLQSMDATHVALVDIFIKNTLADTYECLSPCQLGIDFDTFHKILECSDMSSSTKCTIKYTANHPDRLKISFTSSDQTSVRKKSKISKFDMKILDIESSNIEIPESVNHSAVQNVEAETVQKIFKDLSVFSDDVLIKRQGQALAFSSHSDSSADATFSFDISDEDDYFGQTVMVEKERLNDTGSINDTSVEAIFSLKYLIWFSKAATLCPYVTLAFDQSQPLLMQFEDPFFCLKFFLAPKCS
ncbi:proliferating cell nuclear antigen, N-terminal domain-containing protein [Blyttiomyces helicus]|uniref:DNA sliding clamp PCNA n=1 Tax=Blyttiomyces helicus TaxID=388810 RepID=A0A4P9WTK7_9FUNG|nr:proliferating cell nuclear antigen, N-terminal domain-containing protein [Blyttiomyces helicus]|eukprot:RKO94690.1 proliferating cell nuclear antigen, N-terminal domain-containing protein [Blyttiomyces helicus]